MSNELIPLEGLTLDELAEMANLFGEKCQQAAKLTVQDAIASGRALLQAKELVEHGEWSAWLRANFNYSRQTAATYMTLGANVKRFTFEKPESIRDAIRIIGQEEEKEPDPPKSERIPDRVKISEPDPDPTLDPPSTRKTAKGSERKPEASKPKTTPIVPEVVEDEPASVRITFAVRELGQAIHHLFDQADRRKTAKELRKLADVLDPPTKFVPPDVEEVEAYCLKRKNGIDAEAFVATGQANGWLLSNGNKMKDWKAAIITWEKNSAKFSRGRNNGNGRGRTDDGIADQAARLKEIFG